MNLSVLFLYYFGRLDPMVRSWCMRYESKHTYFKQVAIALGNFINVPFTVTDRHQKLQSFHYFNEGDQELSVIINPLSHNYAPVKKSKMFSRGGDFLLVMFILMMHLIVYNWEQ